MTVISNNHCNYYCHLHDRHHHHYNFSQNHTSYSFLYNPLFSKLLGFDSHDIGMVLTRRSGRERLTLGISRL